MATMTESAGRIAFRAFYKYGGDISEEIAKEFIKRHVHIPNTKTPIDMLAVLDNAVGIFVRDDDDFIEHVFGEVSEHYFKIFDRKGLSYPEFIEGDLLPKALFKFSELLEIHGRGHFDAQQIREMFDISDGVEEKFFHYCKAAHEKEYLHLFLNSIAWSIDELLEEAEDRDAKKEDLQRENKRLKARVAELETRLAL
jgi:hypothetical protein